MSRPFAPFGGDSAIGGALSQGNAALFFLTETVFFLFTEEIAWRGLALYGKVAHIHRLARAVE